MFNAELNMSNCNYDCETKYIFKCQVKFKVTLA